MELDKKDHLILEALQTDARQSLAALGKRIGLSQSAMSERVRKLEEAGVIEGYNAVDTLAAHGPVVTSLVLSHPVRKIVRAMHHVKNAQAPK